MGLLGQGRFELHVGFRLVRLEARGLRPAVDLRIPLKALRRERWALPSFSHPYGHYGSDSAFWGLDEQHSVKQLKFPTRGSTLARWASCY